MSGFLGLRRRSGRDGQRGFTLIELLVVLTIIGIASAAVVIAVPDPEGSLVSEAERFAARAKAARDSALLDSRAVALEVAPEGYWVERRRESAWEPGVRWSWSEGTSPAFAAAAERGARTVFDPTGLADPLSLSLHRRGERVAVEIGHDGTIAIRR